MTNLFLFFSQTSLIVCRAQDSNISPNGQNIELLYSRTRCIECTFNGCISVRQDVSRVSDLNGSRIVNGPIEISVYKFPCACNQGPVIPEIKDERRFPPYPWARLNQVVVNGTAAPIRGLTRDRINIPSSTTTFYNVLKADRSDDELFDMPEADFIRLLDKDWPSKYPKLSYRQNANGDLVPFYETVPQIAC